MTIGILNSSSAWIALCIGRFLSVLGTVMGLASAYFWWKSLGLPFDSRDGGVARPTRLPGRRHIDWTDPKTKEAASAAAALFAGAAMTAQAFLQLDAWILHGW